MCLFGLAYFLFSFSENEIRHSTKLTKCISPISPMGPKNNTKLLISLTIEVALFLLACHYIVRCLGLHWLNLGFYSFSYSPSIDSWQIVSKSCWEHFAISYRKVCSSLVHDPPESVTLMCNGFKRFMSFFPSYN